MTIDKINLDKNLFTIDFKFDGLNSYDLGYSDGIKGFYKNPYDEYDSSYDRYETGFILGSNSK